MAFKFHKRRAHVRINRNGGLSKIPSAYVCQEEKRRKRTESYIWKCPFCSTPIRSQRMRSGNRVHFEAGIGLSRIKHACFYRGQGYSKKRCPITPDLFEYKRKN